MENHHLTKDLGLQDIFPLDSFNRTLAKLVNKRDDSSSLLATLGNTCASFSGYKQTAPGDVAFRGD